MDGSGYEFFPGSRFAEDEHCGVGCRDLLHFVQVLSKDGALSDNFGKIVPAPDFLLQVEVFGLEPVFQACHRLEGLAQCC